MQQTFSRKKGQQLSAVGEAQARSTGQPWLPSSVHLCGWEWEGRLGGGKPQAPSLTRRSSFFSLFARRRTMVVGPLNAP